MTLEWIDPPRNWRAAFSEQNGKGVGRKIDVYARARMENR